MRGTLRVSAVVLWRLSEDRKEFTRSAARTRVPGFPMFACATVARERSGRYNDNRAEPRRNENDSMNKYKECDMWDSRTMRRGFFERSAGVLAAWSILGASRSVFAAEPTADELISKGVDFLKGRQGEDGGWSTGASRGSPRWSSPLLRSKRVTANDPVATLRSGLPRTLPRSERLDRRRAALELFGLDLLDGLR